MKSHILHILSLLLVSGITGCTDEIEMPETDGTDGPSEFILHVTLDDTPLSRGHSTVDSIYSGIKSSWVKDDKVVLNVDEGDGTTTNYTFNCINVDGRHGIFKHSGTIPDPQHVSGTLTYTEATFSGGFDQDATTGKYINGCLKCVDNTTASAQAIMDILFNPWEFQTSNNNTGHLRYIPLTTTLTDFDLTASTSVSLKRNFSILKIVLDDFYYPIYKGSLVFVKGLGERPTLNADDFEGCVKRFMTLGKNSLIKSQSDYSTCKYYKYDNTYKSPTNQDRFCPDPNDNASLSVATRPFTDYAVRNEKHKLVLYMVLLDEPEIQDGDMITVGLREQWSTDWYFWRTVPLRAMKMTYGDLYTLDFTKQYGGKYEYECTAAIYSGNSNQYRVLGHIGTKNVGANSITDPGCYYMFGNGDAMEPGEYFPNYPEPTPIYYYMHSEMNSKTFLARNVPNPGGSLHGEYEYGYYDNTPTQYQSGKYLGAVEGNKVKFEIKSGTNGPVQHIKAYWNQWIKGLREMPTVFPSDYTTKWTLLPNPSTTAATDPQFDIDLFDQIELLGANGTVDNANPVGVRFTVKRTKHKIFVPVSGIYEPSAVTIYHQATADAKVQLIEGTESFAAMSGYCLYQVTAATIAERNVQRLAFCFDTSQSTLNNVPCVKFCELNSIMPIRPAFREAASNMSVEGSPTVFFSKYFTHE